MPNFVAPDILVYGAYAFSEYTLPVTSLGRKDDVSDSRVAYVGHGSAEKPRIGERVLEWFGYDPTNLPSEIFIILRDWDHSQQAMISYNQSEIEIAKSEWYLKITFPDPNKYDVVKSHGPDQLNIHLKITPCETPTP